MIGPARENREFGDDIGVASGIRVGSRMGLVDWDMVGSSRGNLVQRCSVQGFRIGCELSNAHAVLCCAVLCCAGLGFAGVTRGGVLSKRHFGGCTAEGPFESFSW